MLNASGPSSPDRVVVLPHPLSVVPPPGYAQHVRSDDPDEVSAWVSERDGHHSRVIHGTGRYGFHFAGLRGAAVGFAWARTQLSQTIRARFREACIHIPLEGPQHYAFGRKQISVAPGSMVFMAPGTEASRRSGAGYVFAMDLPNDALARELRARCPDAVLPWPEFPQELPVPGHLQSDVTEAISSLVKSLDAHAPAAGRIHAESRVIAAIAAALADRTPAKGRGQLAARRVADLEAWIDTHLGDPITMGRLCEVAQASERSLQQAFKARRGMSPMRFVCERRLAAAQCHLSTARSDEDITRIATGLGFTHLGRFALAYREVFGESPSQTLLRGRRAVAR